MAIDSLTPEQEALFPEYVERFTKIGLATCEIPEGKHYRDIVDMKQLREDVNNLYQSKGLKPPQEIEVVDSCQDVVTRVREIGGDVDAILPGAGLAPDAAAYSFYREVLGLFEETKAFEGFYPMIKYGWQYAAADLFIVGPVLHKLHLDLDGNPHHPTEAAIQFINQRIYMWHGTEVPAAWYEDRDNSLTVEVALTWDNMEQRRCAAEMLGWDRVLSELPTKVISEDERGTLIEVDLPDSPGSRFCRVICGTGRTFMLSVDSESTTPLEAVAATYDVTPEEYAKLQVRT